MTRLRLRPRCKRWVIVQMPIAPFRDELFRARCTKRAWHRGKCEIGPGHHLTFHHEPETPPEESDRARVPVPHP